MNTHFKKKAGFLNQSDFLGDIPQERAKDNDLLVAFYQTVQEEKEEEKEEEGQLSGPEAHLPRSNHRVVD